MPLKSVLLLVSLGVPAIAAEIQSVEVEHENGVYQIDMQVVLDVPAEAAFAVMTDPAALPEVNHNVALAELLDNGDLHTIVQMCISFFCREVEQVQSVSAEPSSWLRMTVIPEFSDFHTGRAQWLFAELSPQTSELTFSARLEPKFWIPPLIGPWLVQRKLEQQARVTSAGIERVAANRDY